MWMQLIKRLSNMLEQNSGEHGWSSTRFAFIFTVMISNIVIFLAITILIIKDWRFPDVPEGILWLYALANGLSFAGKVTQKVQEVKETKKIEEN